MMQRRGRNETPKLSSHGDEKHHERPQSSTPCSIVFVFALSFVVGHFYARFNQVYENNGCKDSLNPQKNGWNSIDLFYGNDTLYQDTESRKEWHSQARQDELVATLLRNKTNGYFVDLAANDAVHWSNTFALEQHFQWTGLCIEPTPRYWEHLLLQRRCQVVSAVVGNVTGARVSWKRRKAYSGIVGFDNPIKEGREFPQKYTVTLQDVFDRAKVPRHIDYFSLDVEGAEDFCLQNFDLDRYHVSIMTVERPSVALMMKLDKLGFRNLVTMSEWGETLWVLQSVQLDTNNNAVLQQVQALNFSWNPNSKNST